jgi:hypothetical protein
MHLQQHAGVRIRQGNEARPSPGSPRYCRGTNESKGEISGRRVVCPYSWCHQSKKYRVFGSALISASVVRVRRKPIQTTVPQSLFR